MRSMPAAIMESRGYNEKSGMRAERRPSSQPFSADHDHLARTAIELMLLYDDTFTWKSPFVGCGYQYVPTEFRRAIEQTSSGRMTPMLPVATRGSGPVSY